MVGCIGRVARLHSVPPEVRIRPAVRALLLYIAVQTAVVAVIFLLVAGFFARWDGRAVGVLTPRGEDPASYEVILVEDDGRVVQRTMPAYVVETMRLPVMAVAVAPDPMPDDAMRSRKAQFQLNYLVQTQPEGATAPTWVSIPTTTPQAVGLVLVIWIVGLAIRNMAYAGSPIWIERQRAFLPKAQTQAGSVAQTSDRGRRTRPPPKASRGPRRR